MKARRVLVTLELDTDVTIPDLRNPKMWDSPALGIHVVQVQVNVARGVTPKRKARHK